MLTCRRATERLSRALDGPLPVTDRIGMHAHLVLCAPCRRFRQQLRFLDTACAAMMDRAAAPTEHLSDAARERIATVLEHDRE